MKIARRLFYTSLWFLAIDVTIAGLLQAFKVAERTVFLVFFGLLFVAVGDLVCWLARRLARSVESKGKQEEKV